MARYTIGRSATSDLVLNDPSVSRNHAELTVDGTIVSIRDMGSMNGTFVNGVRIFETRVLGTMDIVKCGNALVPWRNKVAGYVPSGNLNNQMTHAQSPVQIPVGTVPAKNASATLVMGICSLVFSCLIVGLILGIIGISLGAAGRKSIAHNPSEYSGVGMLNAGFVCSIIGTILGGFYLMYWIIYVLILGYAMANVWPSI